MLIFLRGPGHEADLAVCVGGPMQIEEMEAEMRAVRQEAASAAAAARKEAAAAREARPVLPDACSISSTQQITHQEKAASRRHILARIRLLRAA